MNADDEIIFERIERERIPLENALKLLILSLVDRARRFINHALRDGQPVPRLNMPALAPGIESAMRDAHAAGYRRAGLLSLPGPSAQPPSYGPEAAGMGGGIIDAITSLAADNADEGPGGVNDAFALAGWSSRSPKSVDPQAQGKRGYAAARLASGAILSAWGKGYAAGLGASPLRPSALRHVSVMDDATTDICADRDGLTLAPDDPYWLSNWPMLHYGCRSVVIPLYGDVQLSDWRPTIPAMSGFGGLR